MFNHRFDTRTIQFYGNGRFSPGKFRYSRLLAGVPPSVLHWLRPVPVHPPDVEGEGRGQGHPQLVRQEEQACHRVHRVELQAAGQHRDPQQADLKHGGAGVVEAEEDGRPSPVEEELDGVEGEAGGVAPVPPDQVAGKAHSHVQTSPDRSEHPGWWHKGRPLDLFVPRPVPLGDDAARKDTQEGKQGGTYCCQSHLS